MNTEINQIKAGEFFPSTRKSLIGWFVFFIAALILYCMTLAPDLVWQDQGDYQYQVAKMNLQRPGDVVRVHPLFIVTAHAIGSVTTMSYALAANFTSALFGCLALANVFLLVYWLTGKLFPAMLAATVLTFSHSFWFLCVQAQTYSIANAMMTAAFLLFLRYLRTDNCRYLPLIGAAFGLGISAHMMSQIAFAIIFTCLVIRVVKRKLPLFWFLMVPVCWFAAAGLLWYVIVVEYRLAGDLAATISSAIWGRWGDAVFNLGKLPRLIGKSIMFFVLNFPTPLVLLFPVGLFCSLKKTRRDSFSVFLLSSLILYFLFAVRYDVPNQNNFFLPFYIIVSIYIGLGFNHLFKTPSTLGMVAAAGLAVLILPAYPIFAHVAQSRNIEFGTRRHIPYRNTYQYYLIPWQQNQAGPRRMTTEIFTKVPADSIIFADSTTIPALIYGHEIESARSDLTIKQLSDTDRSLISSGRAMFTISNVKGYYPKWVDESFNLVEYSISNSEHIYQIVPRE